MEIKTTGNRSVKVSKDKDGKVNVEVLLKGKHLATLVFNDKEAELFYLDLRKAVING